MNWSTLVGTFIGAAASLVGGFISSWTQYRKERVAFNREKVIDAALLYLQGCQDLFNERYEIVFDIADSIWFHGGNWEIEAERMVEPSDSLDTVELGKEKLDLMCPRASEETTALLSAAACLIDKSDILKMQGISNTNGGRYAALRKEIDGNYETARTDFLKKIRKVASL